MKLTLTVKGKNVTGENPITDQVKLDLQIEDNTILDLFKLSLGELPVVKDLSLTPEELEEVDKQDKKDKQKKEDLPDSNPNEVETVPEPKPEPKPKRARSNLSRKK